MTLQPPADLKLFPQLALDVPRYAKFRELCGAAAEATELCKLLPDVFAPKTIDERFALFTDILRRAGHTDAEIAAGDKMGNEIPQLARAWLSFGDVFALHGLTPPKGVALYPGAFNRVRKAGVRGQDVLLGVDYYTLWRLAPEKSGQPRAKINHYIHLADRHRDARGDWAWWVTDSLCDGRRAGIAEGIQEYKEAHLEAAAGFWGRQDGYRLGAGACKAFLFGDEAEIPAPVDSGDDNPALTVADLRSRLRAVRAERRTLRGLVEDLTADCDAAQVALATALAELAAIDAVQHPVAFSDVPNGSGAGT